ncbi:MAG: hypothetical protein FJ087_19690 [Deltaproteobacteria bacterium]|nr:hypothetical protein [Deltaproteobacteria bacterium]
MLVGVRWLRLVVALAGACASAVAACGGDAGGRAPAPSPFSHEVLSHSAVAALEGVSRGAYDAFSVEWGRIPVDPKYRNALAFMTTPMMPPMLGRVPAPGAPPLVAGPGPLVLFSDDFEVMAVSPMDHFHDALVTLADGEVRYGLHGEIEQVPAGFAHRFVVVRGRGVAATIERWGDLLLADRGRTRTDRYADPGLSHLGYWTDNGAYYYYAKEPGLNEQDTLLAVKADADARGIPFGYFQLDSWWYFKAPGKGIGGPGGLVRWEPLPEMFPDGLASFRSRLGLGMVAHNRWFAIDNDYKDMAPFVAGPEMSLPTTAAPYERFMDDAVKWGIFTYEQDWLMPQFWGVPWLRQAPDRADAWVAGIAGAARARGLTVQICMAGTAQLMQAVDLPAVTTVRTSIDYKAGLSKESWGPQFHTVNMLARAVGVWPFKDNFHTSPGTEGAAEAEALISVLSGGMVGDGDGVGRADAALLARTCRKDGLLLKPDRPAVPIDAMFLPHARPFTVRTHSGREEGTWHYVAAFHLASDHPDRSDEDRLFAALSYDMKDVGTMFTFPPAVTDWRLDLARDLRIDAGDGAWVAWDWRAGRALPVTAGTIDLPPAARLYDWSYVVLAPVLSNGLAVIGETDRLVPMADRRFAQVSPDGADAVRVRVAGVPGEAVRVVVHDAGAGATLPPGTATIGATGEAEIRFSR